MFISGLFCFLGFPHGCFRCQDQFRGHARVDILGVGAGGGGGGWGGGKQHSRLQSRMEFRGFRANASPLAYIYCVYMHTLYVHIYIDVCM